MNKYNINVTITDFNVDWLKIKSACMTTISKQTGKVPDGEWKKKLIISQHSPLRRGTISWKWEEIPYAISTHFARHHIGCEKFVGTQRTDRTGVDRDNLSQMNAVPMEMDGNVQAVLNISERRLCTCADPLTTKYWKAFLEEVKKHDEIVYWGCVPQCVRCGGCVEPFSKCNFYKNLMKDVSLEDQMDIMKRYDIYHEKMKQLSLKK